MRGTRILLKCLGLPGFSEAPGAVAGKKVRVGYR
jgi:hypothetical protein